MKGLVLRVRRPLFGSRIGRLQVPYSLGRAGRRNVSTDIPSPSFHPRSVNDCASPQTNPSLALPTTPLALHHHLASILTRHGQRGDRIVAQVRQQLVLRYNHPQPIPLAIDAIKPVMRYYKSKVVKAYIPITLFPRTAESMALRWLVEAARSRTFAGGRPNIVKGLVDELDAIIQGTSTLFRKRFEAHRNPN